MDRVGKKLKKAKYHIKNWREYNEALVNRGSLLSEYCRRKGLYPEQIRAWRRRCEQANAVAGVSVDRESGLNKCDIFLDNYR